MPVGNNNRLYMKKYIILLAAACLALCACAQKEETPELVIIQEYFNAPAEGWNTSLEILSNAEWKVSCKDDWIEISPDTGSGKASVSVNIAPNKTQSSRQSEILVACIARCYRIPVKQPGAK